MWLRWLLWAAVCLALARPAQSADACRGTLHLTLDTGSMISAERIATILKARGIVGTFFIAAEPTYDGGTPLDERWAPYWRARVAEGHAFASHTKRHWYFRRDTAEGVAYVSPQGRQVVLDKPALCEELAAPGRDFEAMTGKAFAPLWRAPGGRTTPKTLAWATECGFPRHVGWAPAGFLGDELPSEAHPNAELVRRALASIKDGDILMMHLGIRARRDPFVNVLDELLAGLQARGFCFAPLAG